MSVVLLITAAGSATGYSYALACARTQPQVRLITADMNPAPLVSASVFADTHAQVEAFASPGYEGRLGDVIERHRVTHYLPLIDAEIRWATAAAARLPAAVVGPNAGFAAMVGQKDRYEEVLRPLGIRSPRTVLRERPEFPCFAKEAGGFGGRGTYKVVDAAALKALPTQLILQEFLAGPEFTVDCFPMADGSAPFCSVRERVEVKAGVCTKARIAPNAKLEGIARTLTRRLGATSPYCFQAIGVGTEYCITDINARLGGGTLMSAANGSNFFAAHLATVFGGDVSRHLQRYRPNCTVTRQYVEYLHAEDADRP